MRAWQFRGQGSGIMSDRVFFTYPTEAQFREALAAELALHGVKFIRDEAGAIVDAEPRERWVRIHPCELVGTPAGLSEAPVPDGAPTRLTGTLDGASLKRALEAALAAPPGSAVAGVGTVTPQGTGTVSNPGG